MQAIYSNMIATTLLPSNPSTELGWNWKRWKRIKQTEKKVWNRNFPFLFTDVAQRVGHVLDSSFQDGSNDGFMHQQMLFAEGSGGVPVGLAEMGPWKVI